MRRLLRFNVKGLADRLTDFVLPPCCPLCGELQGRREGKVCGECRLKISYVREPSCLRCGKEICDEERELCGDCSSHIRSFVRGFPAMNYTGALPDSIAAFKYHNKRSYAKYYAGEIVRCHGRHILETAPEALVPVPLHGSKLRRRGYNQAELLARELGEMLRIPVDADLICRAVNTLPQRYLDNGEREMNLNGAFHPADKIVKYKKVMLVDDIYTTGATIEGCTRALHGMGIEEVYYTSICIGRGY